MRCEREWDRGGEGGSCACLLREAEGRDGGQQQQQHHSNSSRMERGCNHGVRVQLLVMENSSGSDARARGGRHGAEGVEEQGCRNAGD